MATTAVMSTFGALGNVVVIAFIGVYGALDPGLYRRGALALVAPSLRPRADEVIDRMGETLRGWLGGRLISMAFVGGLTWAGLWLVGLPLAFILGVIAGLLAFIPNIGPLLALTPALLLAMTLSSSSVLLVATVYVGVQAVAASTSSAVTRWARMAAGRKAP